MQTLEEGHQLDFKREMSGGDKRDLAKDAAAMSIDGGVIVIGVDEDGQARADAVHPIPLAGAPEQIQQIIDSNVTPPLGVDIQSFQDPTNTGEGVVALIVDPSFNGPHMCGGRYPARSGATTRYMSESEVQAAYARRIAAQANVGATAGIDGFVPHANAPQTNVGTGGIGRLRVHVRPLAAEMHPEYPRLREPLRLGAREGADVASRFVAPMLTAAAAEIFVDTWSPRGTIGFQVGAAADEYEQLKLGKYAAAVFTYDEGFSFDYSMPLFVGNEQGERCAYEYLFAGELLTDLAIAAAFYQHVPGASLLRVDLQLSGLENAASFAATRAERFAPDLPRVSDGWYTEGGTFPTRALAQDPREAVHDLLDRFLVAFLPDGYDVVTELGRGAPG